MKNYHSISTPIDGFEGPEKKLEIEFSLIENHTLQESSLRNVSKEVWQEILDNVNCKIISVTKNDYINSYVLSESSLFVYDLKIILKTCGTTTLLRCIEPLLQLSSNMGLEVSFVFYSRGKYIFPNKQLYPHNSFENELKTLDKYFNGSGYTFGPVKSDYWHMYVADYKDENSTLRETPDQTLEVLMFDLNPEVMQQFYKGKNFKSVAVTTKSSGISKLIPGSTIDAFQFDPCGYSMNGLFENSYWTIHITPEPHCSYVSFETNISPNQLGKSYTDLIRDVVNTFKPGKFFATLFADEHITFPNEFKFDWKMPGFKMKSKSQNSFDGPYSLVVARYETEEKKISKLNWSIAQSCTKEVEKNDIHVSSEISQDMLTD